jgi:two-component system, NarL family, nitrate/nitrite response regulator NarL
MMVRRAGSIRPRRRVPAPEPAGERDGDETRDARVLVVAETQVVAEALREWLLRSTPIGRVETAVWEETFPGSDCDIVVVQVGNDDALAAVGEVGAACPRARVIAVGVPESAHEIIAFIEAGIAAYVPRHSSLEYLAQVLAATLRGETLTTPRIAAALVERLAALAQGERVTPHLSQRELQVLRLLDDGLSNKEIARRLRIEQSTVKNHVHRILRKLGVGGRVEAVESYRRSVFARRYPADGG